MFKPLSFACVLAFSSLAAACADDAAAPNDSRVPNTATTHDSVLVNNPPAPGGTLAGTWEEVGQSYFCALEARGYLGIYGKRFDTDLRVDGMRVWFQADEPGGGYRELFNGTASGWAVNDSIVGWLKHFGGNASDGYRLIGAGRQVYRRIR